MKKLLLSFCILLIAILSLPKYSFTQNIGIGTNEPLNKLHVAGSLLVNVPTTATNTAPTGPQNKTMVNATTINFLGADSTGRIYDPGGPAGNYPANVVANASINISATCIGVEITVESMGLSTGDSLIIKDQNSGNILLAVGNGYSSTGKLFFNTGETGSLYLIFKSNADANTGTGFSLLFRRLYDNSSTLPAISGNAGTGLFFDGKTGVLRCGLLNNSARGLYSAAIGSNADASGNYSVAMGVNTKATGNFSVAMGSTTLAEGLSSVAMGGFSIAYGDLSFAMGSSATAYGNESISLGYLTSASGFASVALGSMTNTSGIAATAMGNNTDATDDYATAMGDGTTASGTASVAMGQNTTASGGNSTAFGQGTLASGTWSTAFGHSTTASGLNATAMGVNASTNNFSNSFCIGGTGGSTVCTSPNQFMTRFDNYTFWISGSNYAYLLPASNGWAYTSDRNKKERFEELDGETVLKKLSNIPFCSWNFKAADTRQYRHYGIAAQDFYSAFGKDRYGSIGNDTTVSPLDLLGVAYSAIKALEKRTANQQELNKQAVKENDQLRSDNLALQKRLNSLEAKLNELVAIKEKEEGIKKTVAANQ